LALAVALFVRTAHAAEPANRHDWPQYRGNSGFTGVSPDDSVKPPLKLLWSYRLDGDASGDAGAGVTVAGGKVFVNVNNTRSIVALNADTGRFEWEYKESSVGYTNVPAYNDGRLFLWQRQAKKHEIICLDASTGKVIWKQATGAEQSDPQRVGLPIANGMVLCCEGGDDPAVLAFDEKKGDRVWRSALGKDDGSAVHCPCVAGGKVFVGIETRHGFRASTEGAVVALDAGSGKVHWRRQGIFPNRSLVSDGRVVACAMFSKVDTKSYLLDAETGKTLWIGPARFHYNPPSILSDTILIRPYGADCFALDRDTGKERWKYSMPRVNSGCCAPAISGQFAYWGTGVVSPGDLESLSAFQHLDAPREKGITGAMHAIDLTTGKSVWHFATGNCVCGDPALAYGRLYFSSRDGNVYCFIPALPGETTTPEARDQSPPAARAQVEALLTKQPDQPRAGKDWPMQGGSPTRSGLDSITLKFPLELAWKLPTGGRIVAAAAIRDGLVFVGSDSGKILAADLKTGVKRWEFSTRGQVRCSPAVVGGLVYCGSDDGQLYALDADTGKQRWTFVAGGPIEAAPAVHAGVVVFAANDHHVYALDRFSGQKLWSCRVNDYRLRAAPVIYDGKVFVGQFTDWVWALDLATGAKLWRSYVPVNVDALACYRDKLYVRNPNWNIELDPRTGKRLRVGYASWGWGGLAFAKNRMYNSGIQSQYGLNGAVITDLDEPGTPINRTIPTMEGVLMLKTKGTTAFPGMGTPLALGDKLCFAAVSGMVSITDLDGKKSWSQQLDGTCHASPVAADGMLVVGCDDGNLYAFREKLATDRK